MFVLFCIFFVLYVFLNYKSSVLKLLYLDSWLPARTTLIVGLCIFFLLSLSLFILFLYTFYLLLCPSSISSPGSLILWLQRILRILLSHLKNIGRLKWFVTRCKILCNFLKLMWFVLELFPNIYWILFQVPLLGFLSLLCLWLFFCLDLICSLVILIVCIVDGIIVSLIIFIVLLVLFRLEFIFSVDFHVTELCLWLDLMRGFSWSVLWVTLVEEEGCFSVFWCLVFVDIFGFSKN